MKHKIIKSYKILAADDRYCCICLDWLDCDKMGMHPAGIHN